MIGEIGVMCGNEPLHQVKRLFAVYAEADMRRERVVVDGAKARACKAPRVVVTGHPDDFLAGQVFGDIPVAK